MPVGIGSISKAFQAATILPWLNSHQEVQEVLSEHFEGRAISDHNLSEWKQRGYLQWLRHEQALECARGMLEEAEELENELEGFKLIDRVNELAAVALLQLLREAQSQEDGPARKAAVLELVRELQRLRRGDHEMRRVQIKEERWLAEQQAALKAEKGEAGRRQLPKGQSPHIGTALWQEYRDGIAKGKISPERAAKIREFFENGAE
jgi:hypothetical protein